MFSTKSGAKVSGRPCDARIRFQPQSISEAEAERREKTNLVIGPIFHGDNLLNTFHLGGLLRDTLDVAPRDEGVDRAPQLLSGRDGAQRAHIELPILLLEDRKGGE